MFQTPLELDAEAIAAYEPPQPMQEPGEPKPFAANDSVDKRPRKRIRKLDESELRDLVTMMEAGAENLPKRSNGKIH